MAEYLYERVDAVLYDPVAANRAATAACLQGIGFRKIEHAADIESLARLTEERAVDLILCEVAGVEGEICAFIQSLRNGRAAANPFAVVMATTWRRDANIVNEVVNAGADDLIARPFSAATIETRIRTLLERRKPFVISAEYAGPDRRRDSSRSGQECMDVVNPLAVKADSSLSEKRAEQNIAEAVNEGRRILHHEKIRSDAFQMCVMWRVLEQRRPSGNDFSEILARMKRFCDDIKWRAADSGRADTGKLCDAVNDSLSAIETMTKIAVLSGGTALLEFGPPMNLLSHAVMTLGQVLAPDEVKASKLIELDELVARIDVRRTPRGPAGPKVTSHRSQTG